MEANRPRLGISLLIRRGAEILLVRRGKAPFAGRLSLPGGGVEFGETLAAAARREALEETGLALETLRFLRFHEAIDAKAGLHVVIAVFSAEAPAGAEARAGDDAADILWRSETEIAALDASGETTPGLSAALGVEAA